MRESQQLLNKLTQMDYSKRADKVVQQFPDDLDALIISHLTNIRYLTGFTGSNGLIFLTRDSMTFITDGRYTIQSRQELTDGNVNAEIRVTSQGETPYKLIKDKLTGSMCVGLESTTLSWSSASTYMKEFPNIVFVPTTNLVENVRIVKEIQEVDRIRTACRIADDALSESIDFLKSFPTEREFARYLDRLMIDFGAQSNSFETIVASGKRGALPHAVPTESKIEPNQMIVIDFGCMVDGYCSDMTRTLSVGEPDGKQIEMYNNVYNAQSQGCMVVTNGVDVNTIDDACRNYLASVEMEEYFTHSTGHGVGLDIHEQPWVKSSSDEIAYSGYVLTVEPGVYIEGLAGVRIEDTLYVTDAKAEILTTYPKELVIS